MILKNARWLTAEGYFEEGHIEIENGRIVRLGRSFDPAKSDFTLDVRGCVILPGAIDPHVHFREPGQMYKEGIRNASLAALKGGVTTVIDMPNNRPPTTNHSRVMEKRKRFAAKSLVNWGIMLHAVKGRFVETDNLVKSVKIYMAKSSSLPAITSKSALLQLFEHYATLSIHAEDETFFLHDQKEKLAHHEWRPREAITGALQKIEQALKNLEDQKRPRVVICHMNTRDEVQWLGRMKAEGFDVWGETCPHYLFFTQDDYLKYGTTLQVNPPIRTEDDRQALLQGLSEGVIDFIGTDHAPHTLAEKQSANPPSGIASIEWLMPQLLYLIDEGVIKWRQLNHLIAQGGAHCYAIQGRDGIKEGNWADLVMVKRFDRSQQEAQVISKTGINLYKDFDFRWKVEMTMVNGIVKYRKGKFVNDTKGMAI
ncbi:dihydroorotase [Calditrichota bacterium GD2]